MTIEQYEHRGMTVRIEQHDDADSPLHDDNVGTIMHFNTRDHWDGTERADEYRGAFDDYELEPTNFEENLRAWQWAIAAYTGAQRVLPIWHYTHGSMTVRVAEANPFHCQWDSGLFGFIFDTPEGVKRCGTTPDWIERALTGEVETWDQWLRGDIYGYVVQNPEGDHVGSCWGFYDMESVKHEANHDAEYEADRRVAEEAKFRSCMAL